ncbi:hypothetical protein CHLRE_01g042200v5 [Chlamydomonas reinhardtii]|uniref:Uncharacterized protein n=1 Tax=Chlamydomonas reinhardtii TaxID=3055 RepID=A8HMM7_CHLRE|nr:uncharacterized protein CHLRE_01g042200v5 [Chlamydomonas reinhardtii]PNW88737.1 hypothetical protein CHLRE_01g042200v5 [Chlamydomonas reinhardtii]|eukprot:XP_001690159.1 predicted protein [Chlamydomonas reinhardtii]
MALTTLASRKAAAFSSVSSRKVALAPTPAKRMVSTRAVGDVNAPIEYAVGAAILVSLVATAIIPIVLNPGQQAADKIFNAKQKAPLDKPTTPGKNSGKK